MPRFQVPSVASSSRSPRSASTRNTGGGDQVDRSTSTHVPCGQHAREVGGDAAAGHVAERVDAVAELGDEPQQRCGVQAGRLEQRLAPRRAEVGGVVAVLDAGAGDDVAHERVAVGVQSAAGEREDDVAGAHAVGAEDAVGLDDAGRGAGDVVVVDAEEAGVLGGLAADERGAGLGAAARDAATMSAMRSGKTLPHAM